MKLYLKLYLILCFLIISDCVPALTFSWTTLMWPVAVWVGLVESFVVHHLTQNLL